MNVVEVERDILQIVLDLRVTDAAEEVLGVDLALACLRVRPRAYLSGALSRCITLR